MQSLVPSLCAKFKTFLLHLRIQSMSWKNSVSRMGSSLSWNLSVRKALFSPESKHLQLKQKKNDLYQFAQSDELMKMSEEDMKPLPRLTEFKAQIEELKQLFTVITGYEVSEVSMFFAEYKFTDHLLTHEDDLQNRVVAFVYYLNR